jgi:hypothetical protein
VEFRQNTIEEILESEYAAAASARQRYDKLLRQSAGDLSFPNQLPKIVRPVATVVRQLHRHVPRRDVQLQRTPQWHLLRPRRRRQLSPVT